MGWSLVYSGDELEHCQSSSILANHDQFWPTNANPDQSDANSRPIRCQSFTPTNNTYLPILANSGQSIPIWDNQMSIPNHSHANPVPIRCHPGPFLGPIQNQSDPILPIQYQSGANPLSFLDPTSILQLPKPVNFS